MGLATSFCRDDSERMMAFNLGHNEGEANNLAGGRFSPFRAGDWPIAPPSAA
jgi:hypothetical protein